MPKIFEMAPGQTLTLASTSPRRRKLLESLGLPFTIFPPPDKEPSPVPGSRPDDFALACAKLKKDSCVASLKAPTNIVACDTIVVIDNLILGKPSNTSEAFTMLKKLNGVSHTVYSCYCLALANGLEINRKCSASVRFGHWPDPVLKAYADSGEALDKAGAYAIQDKGVFLAESIEGAWTTVVGLPMATLAADLLENGVIQPIAGKKRV